KVQTGYTEEVTAGQEEDNTKNETQEPKQEQEVEKETTNPTEESGQVMTMEATAYGPDCSGCSGVTATGMDVSSGNHKVIAVDPNVIPLGTRVRSEELTSELQSRFDLVCRLLLEKKKKQHTERR